MSTTAQAAAATLHIGWGATDITPAEPVQLAGQHYARISEGVQDPVTATALALAAGADTAHAVILISCDLVSIAESMRDAVRERVIAAVPELTPEAVILNATHTHSAPTARQERDNQQRAGVVFETREIELPALSPAAYIDWAADRIAEAAVAAWTARAPGAIGFGLGQAVVGRNRRSVFAGGVSTMYGDTSASDFDHVEGYEDHSVNLLGTWDADGTLTGLVVNVACPSQVSEHLFEISADYWHDTRIELRNRLGKHLFVLPQCSAAGDQSPHIQWDKAAEARMRQVAGRTQRQEIALRIADTIGATLPAMEQARQSEAVMIHRAATIALPRRLLSEADVEEAMAGAEPHRLKYEALVRELEAHPEMREQPRWYRPITYEYRRWRWFAGVKLRYESEQAQSSLPAEVHVIRLGDMAIATNPFEYYLDFGIRIKAHSPAIQTFLVQLAGSGTYIPSERSVVGKGYGSVPASTPVGPEGGRVLEDWTLEALRELWATADGAAG